MSMGDMALHFKKAIHISYYIVIVNINGYLNLFAVIQNVYLAFRGPCLMSHKNSKSTPTFKFFCAKHQDYYNINFHSFGHPTIFSSLRASPEIVIFSTFSFPVFFFFGDTISTVTTVLVNGSLNEWLSILILNH